MRPNWQASLGKLQQRDLAWCLSANRLAHGRWLWRYFAVVSRLGDGVFWYALIALLPLLYGWEGAWTSLKLAIFGLISLVLYGALKRWSRRPRPLHREQSIVARVAPLDEFSFPSGHTLHAVGFCLIAVTAFPILAWVLVPFAFSVALSRVILGLHYPSDVLAAIVIGGALARLTEGVVGAF